MRGLLEELRANAAFNVEDLEAAYTELCLSRDSGEGGGRDVMKLVDEAKIPWTAFEIFYEEWFGEKDAIGKAAPGEEEEEDYDDDDVDGDKRRASKSSNV